MLKYSNKKGMKRKIITRAAVLSGCLLLSVLISAQHNVTGIVKNIKTIEPVSGANIFVVNNKSGTSTDGKGEFHFQTKVSGILALKVSHVGYHDTLVNFDISNDIDIEVLLSPDSVEINSIIVTATRTQKVNRNISQRTHSIQAENIVLYPATNTDDLLKMIPGIVVNRSWGIFSRNSSVTMRGMPGSSRSLILIDGVPMNKTAGGSVNWHLISPEEIERIEVVKGPGSSLYGMNAMGGVINLITKKADKKINGTAGLGYGSLNTMKSRFNLMGNNFRESRGLYWKLGGFYRQGDGYILEPEEDRDEYSSEAYLQEGNASVLMGYQFKTNHKLELDYRFYKDKRGAGVKVFDENGSYESFTNNNIRLGYDSYLGKTRLTAKAFYFHELYNRQNENVNNSNEYKLVDTKTDKQDMGLWLTFSRPVKRRHVFSWGVDIKDGNLDNEEVYRTSTDELYTDGQLLFSALFIQDEMNLFRNKMKVVAGIRVDYASFSEGWIRVENPTSKTGFPEPLDEALPENNWTQISPKISARYLLDNSMSVYASASSGFMPPKLDDLAGSRKIRKGFKIANPELKPETLNSLEFGIDWSFREKFFVRPSGFYSVGNDFQYLVSNGEFIEGDSDDPVAVYQRQNVTKVEITGAELGIEYKVNNNIGITGSYAWNQSEIMEYNSTDGTDITGNVLNEVPEHLVFAGINWRNKIADLHLDFTFTDDQWYDEENTVIIDEYSLINIRISKMITKRISAVLDVQDLLDERFIDRKGYLSPGRFIMFELKYLIN